MHSSARLAYDAMRLVIKMMTAATAKRRQSIEMSSILPDNNNGPAFTQNSVVHSRSFKSLKLEES